MPEIESYIDLWQEFYKAHPDPTEFRSFISQDAILTRIFNFSSVPSIWESIGTFPFDEKSEELDSITKDDRDHLRRLTQEAIYQKTIEGEWLGHLSDLFQLVTATVKLKEWSEEVLGHKLTQEEIIEFVQYMFQNFL